MSPETEDALLKVIENLIMTYDMSWWDGRGICFDHLKHACDLIPTLDFILKDLEIYKTSIDHRPTIYKWLVKAEDIEIEKRLTKAREAALANPKSVEEWRSMLGVNK